MRIDEESGSVRTRQEPDGRWVLELAGEFDLGNVSTLVDTLAEVPEGGQVVVDFTDAQFIDSTTLEALLRTQNRLHTDGRDHVALIIPDPSSIRRIFDITGIGRTFRIYARRADAGVMSDPQQGHA